VNKIGTKSMIFGIVLVVAALVMIPGCSPSTSKVAVNPPGTAEGLPFSNGILVGNTLYVAGQEGLDNGKLRPGGIAAETQAALENVKKIVEAAGLTMDDVVSVNVYLADIGEFAQMNQVYKTFFPEPRPARATVQVAALVNNARVEIGAIAVKTKK